MKWSFSCNPGDLANDLDGNEKEWLPTSLDVVIRVQGAVLLILLYAYRLPKVSFQRIYNKRRLQMQSNHMANQGAFVEKNLASLPALQLADNVLLTLPHDSP